LIYGYCRVSTKGQLEGNSIEEQTNQILDRYSNAEIIVESFSGIKERVIFNELIAKMKENDLLCVTKLDRFCRSAKEGLTYIDDLLNRNIRIHILNMGLIENSSMGRLITTCLLAFAEFERSQIIERTQSGKAIAKTKDGFKEGRPRVYKDEQINLAMNLLGNNSYKQVEKMTGISKSTLIRAKKHCT